MSLARMIWMLTGALPFALGAASGSFAGAAEAPRSAGSSASTEPAGSSASSEPGGPAVAVTSPGALSAMDLQGVLTYALGHAPTLAQAKESLRIRDWQGDQAQAKFLPSLDLTTNQGYLRTEPDQNAVLQAPAGGTPVYTTTTTQSPWFGQFGLNLTETLYDNGQSLSQQSIADANREGARLTALMTRDDVILAVTKAYYALAQAEILLATNVQQARLTDKQLSELEAFYHQGLKTKREYLRFKSQAQRAALEVMNTRVARRGAEIDLRKAMGLSETAEARFTTLNADEVLHRDPAVPTATPSVEHSYIALIAAQEDLAAAEQIDLARRKNLPVVSATSGVGYQTPDYLGIQGRPWAQDYWSWNVTVGITYNIWDAGSRRHDIDIAASQRQIHTQDTADKLQGLAADIAKLMDNLSSLHATFLLNKELLRLEQENFANIEDDYRQGKVAYLDLVAGLTDLLSAKVNFYTTYISIETSLAQYRYYEGTIYGTVAGA